MGCPWSRPHPPDGKTPDYYDLSAEDRASLVEAPSQSNGHPALNRRDTPAKGLLDRPSDSTKTPPSARPATGMLCSSSQTEFFKMLDEKIAQGLALLADMPSPWVCFPRSAIWSKDELYMQAKHDDCDDPAEVLRIARLAVKEANNRALRLQNQTTQQLVQRVKDLKYWAGEIDRELQDLKEDNDDIVRYFRKLNTCVVVTQDAVKCNEACFAVRRKRIHVDNHDRVDNALNKEKDVINDCVKQMREFNGIVEKQMEINAQSKNKLLRDYTLKQEAVNLDHRAAAFGTDPRFVGKRSVPGEVDYRDTVPLQRMSEYQEWVENTAANLNMSSKSRARSRKIVQKLINSTREFAQAMRQEAINVENTLKDSIKTWTEWRDSLAAQLKEKDKEMKVADAAVNEISHSLNINGNPLQVALMRQNQRGLRPGIELCNDKAQHALQAELNNLKSSMLSLEHQLDKAKESRRKLDGERYRLERKLEICQQNVAVDYEVLRQIRATYPQEIQLSGFLVGELPKPIMK